MARFRGVVELGGRSLPIEVERSTSRTRIVVDGRLVLNEKPFVPKTLVAFQLMAQSAALRFTPSGLREDCVLELASGAHPLLRVERDGRIEGPDERSRRMIRTGGLGFLGAAVASLIYGLPNDGWYRSTLHFVPFLSVFGIAILIAPVQLAGLFDRPMSSSPWVRRGLAIAALAAMLLSGEQFAAWVLARYGGP